LLEPVRTECKKSVHNLREIENVFNA